MAVLRAGKAASVAASRNDSLSLNRNRSVAKVRHPRKARWRSLERKMKLMRSGNRPATASLPSASPGLAAFFAVTTLCTGLVAAPPVRAAPLDEGIAQYRSRLIADVDRTLAGVQTLRAAAAAGDLAAARQAWIDARAGWERSEVFTTGFVPELDREIDAWPNGAAGFHAVEARLFGAGRTDVENEVGGLLKSLGELSRTVRDIALTPQGLLDGAVRLAYEVGESKVDGGESRVSGSSLDDMRNNADGIDAAWRILFAPAVEAQDHSLGADIQHGIDAVKAIVAGPDLRRIDPDALRAATEELVLKLQNAAPLLGLQKPALEAGVHG
jgi:iron uptake system EfeUOB component EfeO/EfeM